MTSTVSASGHAQSNPQAIVLMVAAMGLFAIEDAFIKLAGQTLGIGQCLVVLCIIGVIGFVGIALRLGDNPLPKSLFQKWVIIRTIGEVFGSVCFVSAIVLAPLSTASAILQATPLAVTLGAAIFLSEPVGWRRWTAIGVGFVGVLLIIQPGTDGFVPSALLAVGGVIGLALRDVATRALPVEVKTAQVATFAYLALLPFGIGIMMLEGGWQPMTGLSGTYIIAGSLVGIVSYYAITLSLRLGEVSVVAPFRYSRLVFALVISFLVFGEVPNAWMWVGSAIVIATGLYSFHRERVRMASQTSTGA
ncbi:MAG: DMT family transporter [Pseudomonadota bacterium]